MERTRVWPAVQPCNGSLEHIRSSQKAPTQLMSLPDDLGCCSVVDMCTTAPLEPLALTLAAMQLTSIASLHCTAAGASTGNQDSKGSRLAYSHSAAFKGLYRSPPCRCQTLPALCLQS